MRLLFAPAHGEEAPILDEVWGLKESFAYVPRERNADEAWLERALTTIPPDYRTDHFALLTSGSTGRSKLVVGSRERAEALARTLHSAQGLESVRETIAMLPLSYSYAFVNQWLWAHVHGRALVQTAGFARADKLFTRLEAASDAMLCMVGVQVPLMRALRAEARFPGVRVLNFAGGRFPQEHLEWLRGAFPQARIYNNYGCVEAMPRLTLRAAEAADAAAHVGWPLEGVTLRVDEEGRLLFRSRYGAVGSADDTGFHTIDAGEFLPTGDLGAANPDGSFTLHGRANEVFKRHGEKVSLPALLDLVVDGWSGTAAFYVEEDEAGEPAHVLVLSPAPAEEEYRALLKRFRDRFSRAHWPARLESVPGMPTLPSGKVDLDALRELPYKTVHWSQPARTEDLRWA